VLNFVRFLIFFAVVITLVVVVALPALASPFLTRMVRDAGVQGGELNVTIGMFDPAILEGRAGQLRIEGRGVTIGPATVGAMDLTLFGASYFDRTFDSVRGNLRDVGMTAGGVRVEVARVEIEGPADSAVVVSHFTPAQGAEIIRQAARRAGVNVDGVELTDGGLRVTIAGVTVESGVAVEGGALVLRAAPGLPTVLLLQPAPTDPWRLTDGWISRDGITLRGVVDAATVMRRAAAAP
jgi:hypothetical protein